MFHFISYKDVRDMLEVVENKEEFEALVKRFFISLRVDDVEVDKMTGKKTKTGQKVYPTIGYMKNIKCTLFGCLVKQFKVDLTDLTLFPTHCKWWTKILEDVKKSGRGTVTHKKELHDEFGEMFMDFAYHLLEVNLKNVSYKYNVPIFRLSRIKTSQT